MAHQELHCHSGAAGRRGLIWLAIAALMFLAAQGCGSEPVPDRLTIAQLIQNADEFRKPRTLHLSRTFRGGCETALANADHWRQLANLALILVHDGEHGVCTVELSEEVRRETSRTTFAENSLPPLTADEIEIPIAVRNFLRVLDFRPPEAQSLQARFAWEWQPNLMGRKLGLERTARTGTAVFWLDSDGWRLVRLDLPD
jgi:hypothetical protein